MLLITVERILSLSLSLSLDAAPTNGDSVFAGSQGCSIHSKVRVYTKLLPLAFCPRLQTLLLWVVPVVSIP